MKLGVRWTIDDPVPNGWEALRLSITGDWKLFGREAEYAASVNHIGSEKAKALVGELPCNVHWHDSSNDLPDFIRPYLDQDMAEGAGWKFAPLRLFPHQPEISLDNDCILWAMPAAMKEWLSLPNGSERCLILEDVVSAFGKFAPMCGSLPLNCGIRGFPPNWDLGQALLEILTENPVILESEQDEQGLAISAILRSGSPLSITNDEVTICSPFPPHMPHLGTCGAHFVGLNAKVIPWEFEGVSAVDYIAHHWARNRSEVASKVGLIDKPARIGKP